MKKFSVTYYYLATGMEGRADIRDYGIVEAESRKQALEIVGNKLHPGQRDKVYQQWGLSAKEI